MIEVGQKLYKVSSWHCNREEEEREIVEKLSHYCDHCDRGKKIYKEVRYRPKAEVEERIVYAIIPPDKFIWKNIYRSSYDGSEEEEYEEEDIKDFFLTREEAEKVAEEWNNSQVWSEWEKDNRWKIC